MPSLQQQNSPEEKDTLIADLRERVRLLELLIDTSPDRLSIKDRDSRFLYANQAVIDAHQVDTRDALIGTNDFDHQAEELASGFYAKEQDMMAADQSLVDEEELNYDDDGSAIWYSTNKIPHYDNEGGVAGLVIIARDITRLKVMEQQPEEREKVIQAQRDILREVSTPILPIFDRVLVMPLIGEIDSERAQQIMRTMLQNITEHRAKIIIIDITGVPTIDTGVADYLNRTIQAARLKGAESILTGVSDAVAETIIDLGIDWSHMAVVSDLQNGLRVALEKITS